MVEHNYCTYYHLNYQTLNELNTINTHVNFKIVYAWNMYIGEYSDMVKYHNFPQPIKSFM